ncbi:hypothetical protein ACJ4V0_06930 [Phreatobacter sp. HK31-P]
MRTRTSPGRLRAVAGTLLALGLLLPALPHDTMGQDLNARAAQKCDRYRQAWEDALRRRGADGLGRDFLDRHARFMAGGCLGPADICPRTGAETDLANLMTVRAMNAGMASTFLPWACR